MKRNTGTLYLVATTHEWTTGHVHETHVLRDLLPSVEFSRFNVAIHFHMTLSGAHVLPKSDNIYINFAQFCKRGLEWFRLIFTAIRNRDDHL